MSFSDDAVKAKLSALNETQESIVTVAQWIMFHKRYADRTAQLWLQRLKDSAPPKRLILIYLANEVIQQSKVRKKDDFLIAFTPIMAESIGIAAKGANHDILHKLRRNIEVWRSRVIFDEPTQIAIEARLDEIDQASTRAPAKKALLGGSLFSDSSSAIAAELQPLITAQSAVAKTSLIARPLVTKAEIEYTSSNDASKPTPPPPAHAAQLNALIKALASAEDAVSESLKTRKSLIEGMEKLLETARTDLATEEKQQANLTARKLAMTTRRQEVEDSIMRALPQTNGAPSAILATDATAYILGESAAPNHSLPSDLERPEVERFTPPPLESTTPPGIPPAAHTDGADDYDRPDYEDLTPPPVSPSPSPPLAITFAPPAPPTDPRRRSAASTKGVHPRAESSSPVNGLKRRKVSGQAGEYLGFAEGGDAMEGLDADVVGMLG